MKKTKVSPRTVHVECVIPEAGYIHDLTRWFGRRSIINGKMVWKLKVHNSTEFVSLIKKIQAEKNIQLNWRVAK